MKQKLLEICKKYGYKDPNNKSGITLELLIDAAISGNIVSYTMEKTGCAKQTVTNALKATFPDRRATIDKSIIKFLLAKENIKKCPVCNIVKLLDDFYTNISKNDGYFDSCKVCSKAARIATYNKNPQKERIANDLRKRGLYNRIPIWSETAQIEEFYKKRPEGYHVDHVIPLHGALVSGLHVLGNLQYLTAQDNLSKNNKFEV